MERSNHQGRQCTIKKIYINICSLTNWSFPFIQEIFFLRFMISWSARRWIWVEEQKRRQRWQRRRKFQREGWGRAIPEILVIMAMDRWRTLSRQGNVEPNLRISWISTVSPQTWPTAYEIVMILCKRYYKNIFLGVAWWSNNHFQ